MPKLSRMIHHATGRLLLLVLIWTAQAASSNAQVVPAGDAPQPLAPHQSERSFRVPPAFRMELVAAEPLIAEPSGVCWDEYGRLYVSELHGYNLEGQYDIDELNRSGELDRVVRRIQANDRAKEAALAGTYGVVKRLFDDDGDGRMDRATVFADNLPPCYGLVAARGGIIVACAPDIVYLADHDGDGRAEIREVLFTGFKTGVLERGINAPQWGPDNWIYFGGGHGADSVTGPRLPEPVRLGSSDFRIRSDGSAIEPVAGRTHTFGHAFTPEGDRVVISTSTPGIQVIPLPWRYLARNADLAVPSLERNAAGYNRVFPVAPPHPWRTRRAEDPGFYKYYRDRYGASDSEAGGYFTSACSPIVYQDVAFPEEYRGDHFVCEPAQNLIHRAKIRWEGPELRLERAPGEERSEFLASTDQWFHPMNLAHGPDGALYITDFYREIIEDYSAIPRYLQQLYGLTNGMHHGRIWRLTHNDAPRTPAAEMASLSDPELAVHVSSPQQWRRETARRLLVERKAAGVASRLSRILADQASPSFAAINALHTLDGLGGLSADDVENALRHRLWAVRRHAMQVGDRHLSGKNGVGAFVEGWLTNSANLRGEARFLLQFALSLGESPHPQAIAQLARLAREHGDIRWMDIAIASSVGGRETQLLERLLPEPGNSGGLPELLVATVAARADRVEVQSLLALVERSSADPAHRQLFRRILSSAQTDDAAERIPLEPPQPLSESEVEQLEERLPEFLAALSGPADRSRGRELFREHCSACHVARGLGTPMGPPLDAEHQRAPETIVRDILFPHEAISAGHETVRLEMRRGVDAVGVLASESPTSVTLRLPGGAEMTFLRRRIARLHTHKVSLMPAQFGELLKPADVRDIIDFLRQTDP
ncbi:MAG TPA: hypothetical protein DCY13_07310 [Verrucomicrobiales bacterium]|nr:hypothetical protein [Verrucomicrobiales bacterium]